MDNTQIQIQFPSPGEWNRLILTAVFTDAEGYRHTTTCTQRGIPADQAPALAAALGAIASMGEDWQASQVWARIGKDSLNLTEDGTYEMIEAVSLTVEAVNAQGGRKIFTVSDYPAFILTDPAAVAFFKHFTTQ